MYRAVARRTKNLWKRFLGVRGLASLHQSSLHLQTEILAHNVFLKDRFVHLPGALHSMFERIRHSIGVQADSTRTTIIHECELTQNLVARHADTTRAAVSEQCELTRAAVGEQSDRTRSTLID